MTSHEPIIAAADGSSLGNPGPAGWAWYIDEDNWASGGWSHGTNNMGELQAVLELFQATEQSSHRHLKILCDSQYAINCITQWMPGWKKKGWKKSDGKPVLNQDILKELDAAITGRDYSFEWVKGHAGHPLNEAADELARAAATAYQKGKQAKPGPGFTPDAAAQASGAPSSPSREENLGQLALNQEKLLLSPEVYRDANRLDALLDPAFTWITPAGRSVDRPAVIEHRERAFTATGQPENEQVHLLNPATALVTSTVTTARGTVFRTSIWVRDENPAEQSTWSLRFRQESAH